MSASNIVVSITFLSFGFASPLCSSVTSSISTEKETSFFYAEIEFTSEEEAGEFCVPEYFGEEITHVAEYKMKNYWKRTDKR